MRLGASGSSFHRCLIVTGSWKPHIFACRCVGQGARSHRDSWPIRRKLWLMGDWVWSRVGHCNLPTYQTGQGAAINSRCRRRHFAASYRHPTGLHEAPRAAGPARGRGRVGGDGVEGVIVERRGKAAIGRPEGGWDDTVEYPAGGAKDDSI